ncbi:MAG TPA: T9SS type A sorting domain-containing protein [Bacteroidales bacterium]|nr:T9SS type A sorting domain-containing protein [Bacteroidales bacterium]HPS17950.1 T9SS type A sorting domain-containing protein [Bacteroidales bacterium]
MCSCSGTVVCVTSINEPENENNISIYPNPTDGKFTIDMNELIGTDFTFEISDVTGKVVHTEKMPDIANKLWNIDISGLSNGNYFLRMYNSNTIIRSKILKK